MTHILLAWNPLPFPQGTSFYAADLSDPQSVVQLFKEASHFRTHITPQGWQFLWTEYDTQGLLEINARAAWIDGDSDHEIIEQLINRAMIAGYDPTAGRFRGYFECIEPRALTTSS
jgi:hypothetical protein